MARYTVQAVVFTISLIMLADIAHANPTGPSVAAGSVSITTPNANTMNITQGSSKAIINWGSFSIDQGQATHFIQPSASSVVLNRVVGNNISNINGILTANGQVFLVNPAGIIFGQNARVNVGSLFATTAAISDQNFLNGNYQFQVPVNKAGQEIPQGAIVNNGSIIANHGLVALAAPAVVNNGLIQANLGQVVLASGKTFTISFSNDQMVNFAVGDAVDKTVADDKGNQVAGVINSATGSVIANDGKITMTANVAKGVVDNVINMNGVAEAHNVVSQNGAIYLLGGPAGTVHVGGKIDVSARGTGHKGGNVKILAQNIVVDNSAVIDASGDSGGGNVNIGGDEHGAGPDPNADTVLVNAGANIYADALLNGNGGNVILWSNNGTTFNGSISAMGGANSGNGGFAEISSPYGLSISGSVDLLAPQGNIGTLLLDPTELTISSSGNSNVAAIPGSPTVITADPNSNSSNLNIGVLLGFLNTANTIVRVQGGGTGTGAGDITFDETATISPGTWTAATTLTLTAFNNVIINGSINNSVGGSLILTADNTQIGTTQSLHGVVSINSPAVINMPGGTITINTDPTGFPAQSYAGDITAGNLTTNFYFEFPAPPPPPSTPIVTPAAAPALSASALNNLQTGVNQPQDSLTADNLTSDTSSQESQPTGNTQEEARLAANVQVAIPVNQSTKSVQDTVEDLDIIQLESGGLGPCGGKK